MNHTCWQSSLWTQAADVTLVNPNRAPAEVSRTSLSSFLFRRILLEPGPGFCPRKGSSRLEQLKTLAQRKQNRQRQPSLPLRQARMSPCPGPVPALLGHKQARPRGHALTFLKMHSEHQKAGSQKAPGTVTDSSLSKLGLLLDKKCAVGGRDSLVQEDCVGIAQTRGQVLPLKQEFLILLCNMVLFSGVMFLTM